MDLSEAKKRMKDGSLSLDQIALEFRADQEVVLNALSRSPGKYSGRSALAYASDDLRSKPDFILKAAKKSHLALGWASRDIRSNKEVVIEIVREWGWALEWASDELKADRAVVLANKKIKYVKN